LPITQDFSKIRISPFFTSNFNFEGIVALSNCSGSLIRLEGAKDTDRGIILTNGHCYEKGFLIPGVAISHVASSRRFTLLNSEAQSVGQVTAQEVLYASMTKTDMALYQLRESYADIKNRYGIKPLSLASHHPQITDPIEVISGYWKRGYTCSIEFFPESLKEDKWTWNDSIRYNRPGCETIGGTSGSPIVLAGSRQVIGVNNTGNEKGEKCSINNPCEVDAKGNILFIKGYSYGQQTYWLYSCLNQDLELDLNLESCLLYQ
jgi:V8-like Glu-specific endopeptidase